MILTDSLLYKIDQRLNKLSTNDHQQIPLEDKIIALNEAQLLLVLNKASGVNVQSGLGMDAFKKRYEDLQNLVIDYSPLDLSMSNSQLNQWSADLSLLDPLYMFYLDSYMIADKGECKDRIIWMNNDLMKHGDLRFFMNNEHYKPSFEYEESFNIVSSDKLSTFTDGTFTPKKIYVMYLRYPAVIDKEGYIKFDGTESVNSDCELEDYLEDELINTTILKLARYIENQSAEQGAQLRITTSE